MLAAINAWTFPAGLSAAEQLAAAAAAGFDGIELTLDHDGPLRFDTPLETCAELARRAAALNLEVVSLASGEFWQTNYAEPDEATRQAAVDLTLRMLDRAAAFSAGAILVVPAVVGTPTERQPRVSYTDALRFSYDALRGLRHAAEERGVAIALENVENRFLVSPLEAAELVDRVNSPCVGWYFDTANVLPFGYPDDWILTLGGRIRRVHVKDQDPARPGACLLGEGSVDWPRVIAALRQVGYDGPLTYEGPGEAAEIRRRLGNIMDGRPLPGERES